MSKTEEEAIHDALKSCDYQCQGKIEDGTRCIEMHNSLAQTYKGRVVLQFILPKKNEGYDSIKMFCFKCLHEWTVDHKRMSRPRKKAVDKDQIDLFSMPPQDKYPGPKNVPSTSRETYHSPVVQKKLSDNLATAKHLVRLFPDKTAWELLHESKTFTDIFILRRFLSKLKADNLAFNPLERQCNVVNRKTFVWRLV